MFLTSSEHTLNIRFVAQLTVEKNNTSQHSNGLDPPRSANSLRPGTDAASTWRLKDSASQTTDDITTGQFSASPHGNIRSPTI